MTIDFKVVTVLRTLKSVSVPVKIHEWDQLYTQADTLVAIREPVFFVSDFTQLGIRAAVNERLVETIGVIR